MHVQANINKKNTIWKITNEANVMVEEKEGIAETFLNYFQNLLGSTSPSQCDIFVCTTDMTSRVTEQINRNLLWPYSKEEVVESLNQMAPTKLPGPYGYNVGFFQHHWQFVGEDINISIL